MPSSQEQTTTELFRDNLPVWRTSLVKHGLVDISASPATSRFPVEPRRSEDLKAADEEDEGWVRADCSGEEHASSRSSSSSSSRTVAGEDDALRALLDVNSVVVGHSRAAEELRRTLLSPQSQTVNVGIRAARSTSRGDSRAPGVTQKRSSSLEDGEEMNSGDDITERADVPTRTTVAGAAAAAAVAAARGGMGGTRDRGPMGASKAVEGTLAEGSAEEGFPMAGMAQPWVSMAAVLDIAVNLFGSRGGRRSVGVGSGRSSAVRAVTDTPSVKNDGLVTFTVDVHTGGSVKLGMGVKELGGGAVVVEDLHAPVGQPPGPAARAGIALGDVVLGINYRPLDKGLVNTSAIVAKNITGTGFVKLQISRAVRGGGGKRRRTLPGKDCPIITELMWRAAQLRRAGVLTSAERHTIAGLILQRMAWEDGEVVGPHEPLRTPAPLSAVTTAPVPSVVKCTAAAQLDSLVLQIKGLREALHVRCLHAKSTFEPVTTSSVWGPPTAEDTTGPTTSAQYPRVTVRYVLRVEDVGTGREWLVFPRDSDFSELHQELLAVWPPIADLPFPTKRPVSRLLLGAESMGGAILDERIAGLEAYLQGALSLLRIYAAVDPRSAWCLRLVHDFLGAPADLFSAELAMPPELRDQKRAELLLYKLLNKADSPAARMKHLLMRDFERDVLLAPDVESLLKNTCSRLRDLQDFVLEQHQEQLLSCLEVSSAYSDSESKRIATRKAVRRQVELSLYLPLRRCLRRELASRLRDPARNLRRAIKVLRRSPPSVFGVENPQVFTVAEWGPAKEAMGQATRKVLPTDQIESLQRAAEHIAALHASLLQHSSSVRAPSGAQSQHCDDGNPGMNTVSHDNVLSRNIGDEALTRTQEGMELEEEEEEVDVGVEVEGGSEEEDMVFVEDVIPGRDGFSLRRGEDGGSPGRHDSTFTGSGGGGRLNADDAEGSSSCSVDGVTANGSNRTSSSRGWSSDEEREGRWEQVVDPGAERLPAAGEACSGLLPADTDDPSLIEGEVRRAGDAGGFDPALETRQAVSRPVGTGSRCWRASSRDLLISPSPRPSRTSSWDSGDNSGTQSIRGRLVAGKDGANVEAEAEGDCTEVSRNSDDAMGADDFLPLFAIALVHSAPFDLLLHQIALPHLMDTEGRLSEEGYLVATLEAAVSFIVQVYTSSDCGDGEKESP